MQNKLIRTTVALAAAMTLGGLAFGYSSQGPNMGPLSLAALPKEPFEARVVERLTAGSYTYFRVERANQADEWVVTLSSSSGARTLRADVPLRVTPIAYSERFASKRLGRVFERLHFAMVRPL